MTKKIIVAVLIPSLLIFLTGCYSMHDITKEDLKTTPTSKLWVLTKSGDFYMFMDNGYRIQRDTLFGQIVNENRAQTLKKIPLEDIASLQTEKMNGGATFLTVLGVIAGVGLIVALIYGALITSALDDAVHH